MMYELPELRRVGSTHHIVLGDLTPGKDAGNDKKYQHDEPVLEYIETLENEW